MENGRVCTPRPVYIFGLFIAMYQLLANRNRPVSPVLCVIIFPGEKWGYKWNGAAETFLPVLLRAEAKSKQTKLYLGIHHSVKEKIGCEKGLRRWPEPGEFLWIQQVLVKIMYTPKPQILVKLNLGNAPPILGFGVVKQSNQHPCNQAYWRKEPAKNQTEVTVLVVRNCTPMIYDTLTDCACKTQACLKIGS